MLKPDDQERTSPSGLGWTLLQDTSNVQQALDAKLDMLDLCDPGGYQVFLQVQLAARTGIEAWLRAHAQEGWVPPCQTRLIARDIRKLGIMPLATAPEFRPRGAHWLGVAFAVARSASGNRSVLAKLDEGALPQGVGYLVDSAMSAYWRSLRARLAVAPVAMADAAVNGAKAALQHFTACAAALIDPPGAYAA